MATTSPRIELPVSIHPELVAIAPCGDHQPEVEAARRFALREKILAQGVNRPVYVWPHKGQLYVLEGIELFRIANDLNLRAGHDYPVVEIPLHDLAAAKKWRFERVVRTQKDVPLTTRCFQAIELFKDEVAAYREQARDNQRKGGKGVTVNEPDRKDASGFLAELACVSRSTMCRAEVVYGELHRDPAAESQEDRPIHDPFTFEELLNDINRGDKPLKNVAEDIKNERDRKRKCDKNAKGAPEASEGFVCDTDYDPAKQSQIICGDSIDLMEKWSLLPFGGRPQPAVIFGSPPYFIPAQTGPGASMGRINYGDRFAEMWQRRGIESFSDYVEKYLRPYIVASYALLPKGGRLVIQVDNTRGRDAAGNLVVHFHTDEIRRIGREIGFIPSAEIIWRKLEISGRKQGFGSRNSPTIRPNHEYIVVLRKDCNSIDGDFEPLASAMNELALSSWDEKAIDEWTERERALYTADIWEIGAARSRTHPAAFTQQLADRVIRLFAPLHSVVLDPWNGSGTTSAMAVLTQRNFIGIDIEPFFCETATKRVGDAVKALPRLNAEAHERVKRTVAGPHILPPHESVTV